MLSKNLAVTRQIVFQSLDVIFVASDELMGTLTLTFGLGRGRKSGFAQKPLTPETTNNLWLSSPSAVRFLPLSKVFSLAAFVKPTA